LASAVEVTTQRPRPRPAREVFYVETTLAMPTLVDDGDEKKAGRRKRERKTRAKISLPEITVPNEDTRRGIFMGIGVSLAAMVITFVVVSIVVARTRAPAAPSVAPSAVSSH
jgi:hypothetical protein